MTIAHAESYLARLREESAKRKRPTKRAAKAVAEQAWCYAQGVYEVFPSSRYLFVGAVVEAARLAVRVYDESIRLRAIAEGK